MTDNYMVPTLLIYKWGNSSLKVVASDKDKLDQLLARLGTVLPVGCLTNSIPLNLLHFHANNTDRLVEGWTRNLKHSGAMIALGLSAL